MKTTIQKFACVALLATTVFATQALTITTSTTPQWTGDQTGTSAILSYLNSILPGGLPPELYKQDQGGSEGGTFASSYTTTFSNTPTDPEDAEIKYDGAPDPSITSSTVYLLVKDGNSSPAWYLFDISGWNGTETISIVDFWAGSGQDARGAISHVSLYGGGTNVPDGGATAILLGLSFLGLAAYRRRS